MKKGKALMRRIGMLTSGGDCQSLNATMRGVAKSLYKMFDDIEIVGFEDGYKGAYVCRLPDYETVGFFRDSDTRRYDSGNFQTAFQADAGCRTRNGLVKWKR